MISTQVQGPIARILLHRPEARNAFSLDQWEKLAQAAEALASSAARVVLLESTVAGQFCAGADIKAMEAMRRDPHIASRFRVDMRRGLEALAQLPMPTIANVQGNCFGAAVALILACDMRIAGPAARFAITPAKLGIIYPYEDIARLRALVGPGQASRLLLTAATCDAAQAHQMGLVEILGESADAERVAEQIAQNAPESLRALKSLLAETEKTARQDQLFDSFFAKSAFSEGLDAFLNKRTAQFDDC